MTRVTRRSPGISTTGNASLHFLYPPPRVLGCRKRVIPKPSVGRSKTINKAPKVQGFKCNCCLQDSINLNLKSTVELPFSRDMKCTNTIKTCPMHSESYGGCGCLPKREASGVHSQPGPHGQDRINFPEGQG